MGLTYPLEQLRTLLQAGELEESTIPARFLTFGPIVGRLMYIILEHPRGIAYLYQGCESVLETVALANFMYFYTFQFTNNLIRSKLPSASPNTIAVASSTLAAVLNVLTTEPLWKVTTILKMKKNIPSEKPSLIGQLILSAKSEGLPALWKGVPVSLWLVANPIIQFTVYEYLKRGKKMTATHAFFYGALSKAAATVATYPLQVAQTRVRSGGPNASFMHVLMDIYAKKGLEGMFQGCSTKLAQTVLTAAFMFAFYEKIAQFLRVALLKRR
jgi:solute carrier family 25 (peroxisomal adenine nucleotide transporter), member 17